jgi:peptidoglycan hydrolase-like protein with peptidoglycan-binding domain
MGPDGAPDPVFQRIFDRKLTLKKGARGKQVKVVQQALVDLGGYDLGTFGPNGDGVDSVFGSKTADAIKKFKVDFNLFGPASSDIDKGVIAELDNLNTVPF